MSIMTPRWFLPKVYDFMEPYLYTRLTKPCIIGQNMYSQSDIIFEVCKFSLALTLQLYDNRNILLKESYSTKFWKYKNEYIEYTEYTCM